MSQSRAGGRIELNSYRFPDHPRDLLDAFAWGLQEQSCSAPLIIHDPARPLSTGRSRDPVA